MRNWYYISGIISRAFYMLRALIKDRRKSDDGKL